MKEILDISDYIFYRMFDFVLKHNLIKGDRDEKRVGTMAIYSLVILIPVLVLFLAPLFRAYDIRIPRRSGIELGVFLLILLLSAPLYVRYWKDERCQNFEKRWGQENPKLRRERGWLIWILIINNLILIPALVVLLEHYNIL